MTEDAPIGPVFEYGPVILWERSVQIALSDFCTPGTTVLDIGANIGGVSIALSRMVGSQGQIHAFECNPRIIDWLRQNLDANRVRNIVVDTRAAFSKSEKTLTFHCEPSTYGHGSSLTEVHPDSIEVRVDTVSIDDYCKERDLAPVAIKIDVEGAEFDVLSGAINTIKTHQPVIVYEDINRDVQDRDCIDFLERLGYKLYDASTYDPVNRAYYNLRPVVSNILAIPPRLRDSAKYKKFLQDTRTGPCQLKLLPGKYVIECQIFGDSTDVAWIRLRDAVSGADHCYHETRLNWLKHHTNSCLVLDCPDEAAFNLEIGSQKPIEDIGLGEIKVYRIESGRMIRVTMSSLLASVKRLLRR